ncbi:MAG: hypothetical protein A3C85_02650 [Candidatus Doudnabacteria bacterium RIFCSPHIGHO2_02_FULL_48_21]|uniref:N-acylneuraminate cytidylyltransferase n=1 Tax=Candidatus Doudnabacteria bacterium RIFCSPLOWO2_02_FULL_48_13 TaxID=1817845 RepID=A0A1F5QC24_9BACT|nr:MAG: hypothetical protein A3K05_03930 [Candidatus Doudnabacteria bacterium RIFCSPHIGHO2_01_48_18]OGE78728.1 MAG: hypothetical protein A2668_04160 [Candidatus Doudnabacteria bacterium RIFCSPHIGHO2_01_FULL_48_180]OGE91402.1 MAG: hypothetical protein A3F44_00590 [Candidatus Doudnabacteria bacterium RIFCSPHIGHO2_12_FULL_47_25]OGE93903.1 MAG: hypothetical protein A3C85_02650 [Candidatus Doudnabacteria bacterium RIFCSPHIGHO2_02_FULL_48_21]OGE97882.1 MAG: hypothetical protein A3A83_03005 [Candidatu
MVKTKVKNIIAIIPARGGSKRIFGKNITELGGLPLLAHSVLQARNSQYVNRVFVSTEDAKIARVAKAYGAEVVKRPKSLASDKATSESALLHVLDFLRGNKQSDPDLVVFLQATSPLRKKNDIDQAIETLIREKADSLFSVCRDKGLMWIVNGKQIHSGNYDYRTRKREQDMGLQYRENGSIYVVKPEILRKYNNRLGGKIAIYEMDIFHSFQIDEKDDIKLVEAVMALTKPEDQSRLPNNVKLTVFDFDGVFTDNKVKSDARGNEFVSNDRTDSLGLSMLRKARIPAMVLSTEAHPVVAARCKKLKLDCHQGVGDKKEYLEKYLKKQRIDPKNVVYVGNDVNDLECFRLVGFAAAPADSHPEVLKQADYVLRRTGGHGAVREICELILKHHDQR